MTIGAVLQKAISLAIGIGFMGTAIDFVAFVNRVGGATPEANVTADAVVALTGGSGLRIAAGIDLVAAGHGERLLISGVNDEVTLDELSERAGGAPEVWACCVDIGYVAETTLGNAEETASWAAERGYRSLIIVTSDYHMPRSQMVLHDAMTDVTLRSWPVRTAIDPNDVWRDWGTFRGMLTEWAKWRVTGLS